MISIRGLDDRDYKWNISSASRSDAHKSGLHKQAREVIKEIFPYDAIHEEVTLPGSNTKSRKTLLHADFFLPARRLMIEVNGEQHSEHIPFFHRTKHTFFKATLRDRDKLNWCMLNDIQLISLEYNETEKWKEQIQNR